MSKELVRLSGISMEYDGETILRSIDLDINDGEFVTLLGPSGCGKTTTLRIIAGFETPVGGDVFFEGKRINDLPPHKRKVNTIFVGGFFYALKNQKCRINIRCRSDFFAYYLTCGASYNQNFSLCSIFQKLRCNQI